MLGCHVFFFNFENHFLEEIRKTFFGSIIFFFQNFSFFLENIFRDAFLKNIL